MLTPDELESVLIQAARQRATLSYRRLLEMGGKRIGPNNVRALMRVLSEVCRRTEERGEPGLACLVVREKDGLPGEGWFAAEADKGAPLDGSRRARVDRAQATAFAFWAERPA